MCSGQRDALPPASASSLTARPLTCCVQYEIELFERVRLQLGWDPSRFNWSCTDWDSMISSLQAGDGVCDLGVAGIDVNIDYLAEGIIFTFPTLR